MTTELTMEQQEQLTPEEYSHFLAYGDPVQNDTELTPDEVVMINEWRDLYGLGTE